MRSLILLIPLILPPAGALGEDFLVRDACEVHLVDDVELHATEAGILDYVAVREGDRVRAEDVLVKIDTKEVEKQAEVASFRVNAAVARAKDEVEEKYARASADHAAAKVMEFEETNERQPKSVPEADLREARLEHKRAVLQIEKAQRDRKLAELDAWVAKKEHEAAELAVERRTLRAPFGGVIVQQFRDEKEWVQPGDPILRLVRLDQLKVEGIVELAQHTPAELDGCPVTVEVNVGKGRVEEFPGRIVYVNPILLRGEKQVVRAEVANRQESGKWLLLPQMTARMTIHLGRGSGGPKLGAGDTGLRGRGGPLER